jgi:hypothetical protein
MSPVQIPPAIAEILVTLMQYVVTFIDNVAVPAMTDALRRFQAELAPARTWLQTNGPKLLEATLHIKRTIAEMAFPNWDLLESDHEWVTALRLVRSDDGVPLVWVPPAAVVKALVHADDHDARNGVLLAHADEIRTHAGIVLAQVTHPDLQLLRHAITQGWAAYAAGLFIPAQTTAASAVGEILRQEGHQAFGPFKHQWKQTRDRDPLVTGLDQLRLASVMCSVSTAVQDDRHVPDLRGFNRHTTAHWIQQQHYSEANALRGLMLVTSAIRELQFTFGQEWMQPRQGPLPAIRVARIADAAGSTARIEA